jgi:CHAT domain-containing protein
VPHSVLHYVPFAALWFKNTGEGPRHFYLCQRFQLSIMPSASFLKYMLNRARPVGYEGHALVLGNPTEDLPGSATEAITVATLLKVTPLLGPQASRVRVLSIDEDYGVIHIASHGTYNENDPLLSGILLSDGLLTVEDMLEARIPAGLLILSGCLTGVSARLPGDELIGLSRAALAAGIPSVITTLWEVRDDTTAIFFERFYAGLRDGMNKDAALTAAQHSMLAEKQYATPSNWAPYVLLGDCR